MLLDHCYAFGLLLLPSSLKKFFEEGTPQPLWPIFASPWIRPLILMHVQGYENFIPIKFRKHPSSGSVVKADYVFPYIHMHYCNPSFFA